jgi:ABC-type lipoprotein release transport system permease subunit
VAYAVHRTVRVVEGRLPENDFELMAGVTAHVKLTVPAERLAVGQTVRFENRDWKICGRFAAGGAIIESEVWVREEDLQTVMRRRSHSFVVARFESPAAAGAALAEFRQSGAAERYFKAWPEAEYYREFTQSLSWVFWLSVSMVAAVVLAGSLIGMNTMYTCIITRLGEIGALRVLGFSRRSILWAAAVESVIMALLGGVVGVSLGVLVDDLPMRFSHGAFYLSVGPPVMLAGLGLSLLIGLLGMLFPVCKGLRLGIVDALRH